ncbi:Zinc finger, RING-type [Corchorus olitorius]|uniref:RING-type E3 ubiquitin transferase n=1 Tax=Corchorus olitorius TaxID=93759 RepID=A0A1R3JAU8_9ROSI|nr:Zinc finger, RING-type [Corchorus olitorius]
MAQISPSPSASPTLSTGGCQDTQESTPVELNLMIIVAAMLCALVCALGLHSMLQCVVQCTQRAVTEPREWVASRRLNSGLKKKEMVALPTSTYANSGSPSSASGCAICLADFSDGDEIRMLPKCNHHFHVACIDQWLLSHSSCPTCRHRLKSNDSVPSLDQIVTAL